MKQIHHWSGGEYHPGASGRSGIVFDPATGVQSGALDLASVADIDFAVATHPFADHGKSITGR